MPIEYEADPHDPTDDEHAPAALVGLDDTDPVELEEAPADEASPPPPGWGLQLTDQDWADRLTGVTVTTDPEDGDPDGD